MGLILFISVFLSVKAMGELAAPEEAVSLSSMHIHEGAFSDSASQTGDAWSLIGSKNEASSSGDLEIGFDTGGFGSVGSAPSSSGSGQEDAPSMDIFSSTLSEANSNAMKDSIYGTGVDTESLNVNGGRSADWGSSDYSSMMNDSEE